MTAVATSARHGTGALASAAVRDVYGSDDLDGLQTFLVQRGGLTPNEGPCSRPRTWGYGTGVFDCFEFCLSALLCYRSSGIRPIPRRGLVWFGDRVLPYSREHECRVECQKACNEGIHDRDRQDRGLRTFVKCMGGRT